MSDVHDREFLSFAAKCGRGPNSLPLDSRTFRRLDCTSRGCYGPHVAFNGLFWTASCRPDEKMRSPGPQCRKLALGSRPLRHPCQIAAQGVMVAFNLLIKAYKHADRRLWTLKSPHSAPMRPITAPTLGRRDRQGQRFPLASTLSPLPGPGPA